MDTKPAIETTLLPGVTLLIGLPINPDEYTCLHVVNGMLLRAIKTTDALICLDCLKTALQVAGRPL